MVTISDFIIVGNQFLKQEAMRYVNEAKIHVIPTVVDIKRYAIKEDYDYKDTVTLGWIGSQSTLHYLKALVPVFEEIARRFPLVQLKIVCNAFFDVPTMQVIKKEWLEEDEVS